MSVVLLGDIGGTNSNLMLYDLKIKKIILRKHYLTNDFSSLFSLLNIFLSQTRIRPKVFAFSIASQVHPGVFSLTNASHVIDKEKISKIFNAKVILLNDFEAIAHSIPLLKKSDILELKKGESKDVLIIGAGTGLGISIRRKNKIESTEDGHTELPENFYISLQHYLVTKYKLRKVTYEDLLSGRGLLRIYSYLRERKYPEEKEIIDIEELSKKNTPCSKETFDLFFRIYSESINHFLKDKNLSSVYVTGGIIEKNLDFKKTVFTKNIENARGIRIITNHDCNIIGLINYLRK